LVFIEMWGQGRAYGLLGHSLKWLPLALPWRLTLLKRRTDLFARLNEGYLVERPGVRCSVKIRPTRKGIEILALDEIAKGINLKLDTTVLLPNR
jgi:hypothetical protein